MKNAAVPFLRETLQETLQKIPQEIPLKTRQIKFAAGMRRMIRPEIPENAALAKSAEPFPPSKSKTTCNRALHSLPQVVFACF